MSPKGKLFRIALGDYNSPMTQQQIQRGRPMRIALTIAALMLAAPVSARQPLPQLMQLQPLPQPPAIVWQWNGSVWYPQLDPPLPDPWWTYKHAHPKPGEAPGIWADPRLRPGRD